MIRNRLRTPGSVTFWDVILLSFRLFYHRILFWIRLNFRSFLIALPLVTAPGAAAALYAVAAECLKDPEGIRVDPYREMKQKFGRLVFRAFQLFIVKWGSLFVILVSMFFWGRREVWWLRSVYLIGLYALVMWLLAENYLYPLLAANPEASVFQVVKRSVLLVVSHPFESLILALVSDLLLFFGLILMGPVMLVVPVLQAVLRIQMVWFLTDELIPGFIDPVEYINQCG